MIVGRVIAYLLMALATLTGLGEAFLYLTGENLARLYTSDLWIIFVGPLPAVEMESGGLAPWLLSLLEWPAWVVCGLTGIGLHVFLSTLGHLRRFPKRSSRSGYNVRHYS
ncbi:hypothetical protein IHV25_02980 [Phaeovibrio sulfidiphilus]|uniref:Uncharacterized protein n=1 Tax=Phaeovibrio sulfidiphilus TaxID=1220600 RepID=A0A8J7CQA0_9PROT|nr:hypothetical protein [Phaeovibrio sulfidiphilus]MBE1236615.1 hypothetical protein [Phaeovibrio sulfidiphilus]